MTRKTTTLKTLPTLVSHDSYPKSQSIIKLRFAAISRSDIPVKEFPEYVKQMHNNRDRKLEVEYKVCSYFHLLRYILN